MVYNIYVVVGGYIKMRKWINYKNFLMNDKLEKIGIVELTAANIFEKLGGKDIELSINFQWLTKKNRDLLKAIIETKKIKCENNLVWPVDDLARHWENVADWKGKRVAIVELDKVDKELLVKLVRKYGKSSVNKEIKNVVAE